MSQIDTTHEIRIQNTFYSFHDTYLLRVYTEGMEKFNYPNLMIVVPDVYLYFTYKILYQVCDWILNRYTNGPEEITNYYVNLGKDSDYPPVMFVRVQKEEKDYLILQSRQSLNRDEFDKSFIEKINSNGPKDLVIIKGGKSG
ncbi:MAG: hypothetical protein ABFD07_09735 [Methanobacterium sp.]